MLHRLVKQWLNARIGRDPGGTHVPATVRGMSDELGLALRTLLRNGGRPAGQYDYEQVAYLLAAAASARYMTEHMANAHNLVHPGALLDFALSHATLDGLVLEFGVYTGSSLQRIAAQSPGTVHGFDSFEGLPEDWTHFQKKGRFSLEGELPDLGTANIVLHKGWFADTLPSFLVQHPGPVRFAHIDCDLYSSAKTVLDGLEPRLATGTIILFDEYLNYPGWERHEHLAFREMISRVGRGYEYLGFASTASSVAVRIKG